MSRVFIAEGPGFFKKDLNIEDVRDNWETIRSEAGHVVPTSANGEIALIMPFLTDSQSRTKTASGNVRPRLRPPRTVPPTGVPQFHLSELRNAGTVVARPVPGPGWPETARGSPDGD